MLREVNWEDLRWMFVIRLGSPAIQLSYFSYLSWYGPAFNRLAGGEGNYCYRVLQITIFTSGTYTFTSKSSLDAYGYLYNVALVISPSPNLSNTIIRLAWHLCKRMLVRTGMHTQIVVSVGTSFFFIARGNLVPRDSARFSMSLVDEDNSGRVLFYLAMV